MAGPRKTAPKPDLSGNLGRPISEEKLGKFLSQLSRMPNVTRAAEFAGIDRSTIYDKKRNDPEFAKQFEEAYRQGYEAMEEEAQRRAFSGFEKPVFYKGKKIATVTEFSDPLAVFLLKGNLSDKFKDRVETTNGSRGGGRFSTLSDEELDAELARRLKNG